GDVAAFDERRLIRRRHRTTIALSKRRLRARHASAIVFRSIIVDMHLKATFALLLSLTALPAAAQQRGQNPNQPAPAAASAREYAGPAEEKIAQTSHTIRLDGREIKYTATAGTLPIHGDDGKVQARMFFVAYTKDGEDVKTRPLSFLFNGGPGVAPRWPAPGSFAPQHPHEADQGRQAA